MEFHATHGRLSFSEICRGYVSPRWFPGFLKGMLRFNSANRVLTLVKCVRNITVDDQHRYLGGVERHGENLVGFAVNQHELVRDCKGAAELIHDPAGYACKRMFSLLAKKCFLSEAKMMARQPLKECCERHFQRSTT